MPEGGSQEVRILWQTFVDPSLQAPYFNRLEGYLSEIASEGVSFELRGLNPPDHHLHRVTELRCGAQVVAGLLEAENQGFDAVVIGHFQDAGLWEARAVTEVPVLGLGESAMLHACTLGFAVGLITISPAFIPWHREQIIRYRLEERVVEITAMETSVELFMRAFEEPEAYDQIKSQFLEHAGRLADMGVETVIPAGGLPGLLFRNEREFVVKGATILNPTPVVAKLSELATSLHRVHGVGTSRHSTFATPSKEARQEYIEQLGVHGGSVSASH